MFAVTWETEESDVDLDLRAPPGVRAFRVSEIPIGFGPDIAAFEGKAAELPIRFGAHLAKRGRFGPAIGSVHVLYHDGRGQIQQRHYPFVLMRDQSAIDLGTTNFGT